MLTKCIRRAQKKRAEVQCSLHAESRTKIGSAWALHEPKSYDPFLSLLCSCSILAGILFAQSTGDKTLVVNGKTATSPVRQIDGRSYVDLETLAEVTNGTFAVEAHRILLTIPSAASAERAAANAVTVNAAAAQNQQLITRDFAAAAIAELAEMREYRGTIRAMITYGLAVSDAWAQQYQEQVLVGLRQAEVAATHRRRPQRPPATPQ